MYKEDSYSVDNPELNSWRSGETSKNGGLERKRGQFDVIGWLIRQNEYAKFAERNRVAVRLRAGEIYEVDFGINVNAEFSYRHYALVLADSLENNPLVLVCPLKSNNKGAHPSSDINLGFINCLDSDHESLAVINQIRTIDKLRIFKKPIIHSKNRFSDSSMKYIDDYYSEQNQTYRLEQEKFDLVQSAIKTYLEYGFLGEKA